MGDISEIGRTGRREVTIAVAPFWADHHFQGRAVLPAVEAMQLMAGWVSQAYPSIDVHTMTAARFDKFLALAPDSRSITAFCDLTELNGGTVRAALATRVAAKTAKMARTIVHAQVDFPNSGDAAPRCPLDLAAALEGRCFQVDPQRIYEDLVPFGPAYRNIVRPLLLTAEGALAHLQAPPPGDGPTASQLGSPFVLDAAFHAACVWSQRFVGVVAFPVGIAQRRVLRPAQAGETYVARIFPIQTDEPMLHFDAWILSPDGRLCEVLNGIQMRDVSGGRLQPPGWIGTGVTQEFNAKCFPGVSATTLIARETIMPFADRCLSDLEQERMAGMGEKRRNGYLSARLACKRLARRLSGNDSRTLPQDIATLAPDGIRPVCQMTSGSRRYDCTLAHDRRFVVAVAGPSPLGVDVEPLEGRILKGLHLFMHAGEQARVNQSELGQIHAAIRVWSIKESVAKALDIALADAWEQTEVVAIGRRESRFQLSGARRGCAFHAQVDDHLITLVPACRETMSPSGKIN